mmetsp:Transcript_36169/g.84696  ORF Transcript_36169/g.84696 Transcript_36169/m.84696 type:complete len:312 (+) Transcript_36169:39-974(+)
MECFGGCFRCACLFAAPTWAKAQEDNSCCSPKLHATPTALVACAHELGAGCSVPAIRGIPSSLDSEADCCSSPSPWKSTEAGWKVSWTIVENAIDTCDSCDGVTGVLPISHCRLDGEMRDEDEVPAFCEPSMTCSFLTCQAGNTPQHNVVVDQHSPSTLAEEHSKQDELRQVGDNAKDHVVFLLPQLPLAQFLGMPDLSELRTTSCHFRHMPNVKIYTLEDLLQKLEDGGRADILKACHFLSSRCQLLRGIDRRFHDKFCQVVRGLLYYKRHWQRYRTTSQDKETVNLAYRALMESRRDRHVTYWTILEGS